MAFRGESPGDWFLTCWAEGISDPELGPQGRRGKGAGLRRYTSNVGASRCNPGAKSRWGACYHALSTFCCLLLLQVLCLNPDKTPRQSRLRDGHRVRLFAKKNPTPRASAPASATEPAQATPTPALAPAQGSQASAVSYQQVLTLSAVLQSQVTLASGTRDGTSSDQAEGQKGNEASKEGKGKGELKVTESTEAPGECSGSSAEADMLDLMGRALTHLHKGQVCSLGGVTLEATCQFTAGLRHLERGPEEEMEPSFKLQMLFRDTTQQLLANRANAYQVLAERAKKEGQEEGQRQPWPPWQELAGGRS